MLFVARRIRCPNVLLLLIVNHQIAIALHGEFHAPVDRVTLPQEIQFRQLPQFKVASLSERKSVTVFNGPSAGADRVFPDRL